MKLNKKLINKEEWFDLDDDKEVKFKIKPFPASHNVLRSMRDNDTVNIWWKMFDYSLLDWEGITDDDNKPLDCNSENKKALFDFSQEVMMFVCNKASGSTDKIVEKKT